MIYKSASVFIIKIHNLRKYVLFTYLNSEQHQSLTIKSPKTPKQVKRPAELSQLLLKTYHCYVTISGQGLTHQHHRLPKTLLRLICASSPSAIAASMANSVYSSDAEVSHKPHTFPTGPYRHLPSTCPPTFSLLTPHDKKAKIPRRRLIPRRNMPGYGRSWTVVCDGGGGCGSDRRLSCSTTRTRTPSSTRTAGRTTRRSSGSRTSPPPRSRSSPESCRHRAL